MNLENYIGYPIEYVKKELDKLSKKYVIKESSDIQKKYDTILVVKITEKDDVVEIITDKFLLDIWGCMRLFSKREKINKNRLPECVAFIIDGNGRWAQKRGLPRMLGHRAGIDAVKKTIDYAEEIGLKQILFYCFSTENWNRPKQEVDGLFELFREFVNKQAEEYLNRGFMFKLVGDKSKIPQDIVEKVEEIEEKTKDCQKMKVGLCINYGGKFDIINAVNNIIKDGQKEVDEDTFEKYLLTKDFKNPDLIIRTSGEQRISNFLLYQMAYSELYFTHTFWPDFDRKCLDLAIIDYQKRNRRFGAIKE